MPLHRSRFGYTAETWGRLIGNPEDRRTAAQSYVESVGGALSSFETTVLLTVEETMDALRTAKQIKDQPPGA